jgi:hypothetical protein
MFGIADPWIVAAYALCILSSLLCIGYGIRNWNCGGESVSGEQSRWASEEDEIDSSL